MDKQRHNYLDVHMWYYMEYHQLKLNAYTLHCILSIKLFSKQVSVNVLESVIIFSRLVFLTYDCNKFAPERLAFDKFAAPKSVHIKIRIN